jgi:hypothetical protein
MIRPTAQFRQPGRVEYRLIAMITLRKAQSFMEYATLIAIIAISLTAMATYIMRSVRARTANVWADLYHPQNGVR